MENLSYDLTDVLKELDDREKQVIYLRFGLDGCGERTLEEVGNKFGIVRQRVAQIECKALRKMRHPERAKKLLPYILKT